MREWWLKTAGLSCAVLMCLSAFAGRAGAQAAVSPEGGGNACEVHVWQSRSYVAATPSQLAAYGLIGAVLQSTHDARCPADTIQGQLERELSDERLIALVAAVPWQQYLGVCPVTVVVEHGTVSKDEIRQARSSMDRRASSAASCYVELYIGDLSFEGGFIKSHLFANLTVRSFSGKAPMGGNAIVWTQLRGFPAQDEAGICSATAALRDGFTQNLTKILAKKIPKASRS
jgi:hypothetical protein